MWCRAEMKKLLEERIDVLPGAFAAQVFMPRAALEEHPVEVDGDDPQIPEATGGARASSACAACCAKGSVLPRSIWRAARPLRLRRRAL